MNYLAEIVAFTEYKILNPLSTGQIALWYALMEINNKCGWIEWFSVPNKVLEAYTGLTQTGVYKARMKLKERGLIDFEFNERKATRYKIISVASSEEFGRFRTTDRTIGRTTDGNTLNKQNKTKQNKNYYNNKSAVRKSPFNNCGDENLDEYIKLEEEILDIMMSDDY